MSTPDPTIEAFVAAHAHIDGDIVQLNATTWALHGFIAYDGEVLLAEFDDPTLAEQALLSIPNNDNRNERTP